MSDVKFSQFFNGNDVEIGDVIVGLRTGQNFQFTFPGTGIKDSNGNFLFSYSTVGASVNNLNFANALTGNPVTISSLGTDTNVDISIAPQGGGQVLVPNPPTKSLSAVPKTYADTIGYAGMYFLGVQAASIANYSATYNNGTLGIGATLTANVNGVAIIDNYTLSVGNTVLFKDQSSTFQNGVYSLTTNGTVSTPAVFTRVIQFNQPSQMKLGYVIAITFGQENATSEWQLNSVVNTIGTDAITFQSLAAPVTTSYFIGVRASSTANVAYTYNNGISGEGATLTAPGNGVAVLDGVTLSVGDFVLIKDQSSTFQNGIYSLTTNGTVSTPAIYTRVIQFDKTSQMKLGFTVSVAAGTLNSSTEYQLNSIVTIIGVDAITFQTAIIATQNSSTDKSVVRYLGTGGGTINTSGVIISDNNQLRVGDGTLSLPSLSFNSNTGHGFSYISATEVDFSLAGTQEIQFTTTNTVFNQPIQGPTGSASTPSFNFITGSQSGFFNVSFNEFDLSVAGTAMMAFKSSTTSANMINGNSFNLFPTGGSATSGTINFYDNTSGPLIKGQISGGTTTTPQLIFSTGSSPGARLTLTGTTGTLTVPTTITDTTTSSSASTGCLILDGGLGIGDNVTIATHAGIGSTGTTSDSLFINSGTGLNTASRSSINLTGSLTASSGNSSGIFGQTNFTSTGNLTTVAQALYQGTTMSGSNTITNLATIYIQSAMSGGGNTVTNGPYALWSAAGANRFDGTVTINNNLTVTGTNTFTGATDTTAASTGNNQFSGGLYVAKNIYSSQRSSSSPWKILKQGTATLGTASSTLSITSIPAFNSYKIYAQIDQTSATTVFLRMRINTVVSNNYNTMFIAGNATTATLNINTNTQGWFISSSESGSSTYGGVAELNLTGKVTSAGVNFRLTQFPSWEVASNVNLICGGFWTDGSTTQVSSLQFDVYNSGSATSPITTGAVMNLYVEVYGSNLTSNTWSL